MKVRPAATSGGLAAAMAEVVEIPDRPALLAYLAKHYWYLEPTDENVTIAKHGRGIDARNGWDTYMVTVGGKAALFTDGPMTKDPK